MFKLLGSGHYGTGTSTGGDESVSYTNILMSVVLSEFLLVNTVLKSLHKA